MVSNSLRYPRARLEQRLGVPLRVLRVLWSCYIADLQLLYQKDTSVL